MFLPIEFQEEYKRLEKLCNDYLLSTYGVTAYIRQMESTPIYHQRLVESWDVDYRHLKRVRWVRNQLAHVVGTLDSELCTENDLEWILSFRNRIINQQDPFAIIRIKKTEGPVRSCTNKKADIRTFNEQSTIPTEKLKNENLLTIKVGDTITARTHAEFLNALLKKNYVKYMKCTFRFNPIDTLWMIKLDNKKSKEGWCNALVENGHRVVENYVGLDYERLPQHKKTAFHQRRYIFDIIEDKNKNRNYVFRGVFDFARTEGSNDYRVWKKMAESANFINLINN